jgi:hypothetical protein
MVNESILSKDFWDFIFKILASVGSLASAFVAYRVYKYRQEEKWKEKISIQIGTLETGQSNGLLLYCVNISTLPILVEKVTAAPNGFENKSLSPVDNESTNKHILSVWEPNKIYRFKNQDEYVDWKIKIKLADGRSVESALKTGGSNKVFHEDDFKI